MHQSNRPTGSADGNRAHGCVRTESTRDMACAVSAEERAQIQFGAIFEHSPNSMAYADPSRRLVRVNRKFTELFGYSEEECLGRTTAFLYAHPEDYGETGRTRYNLDAPFQPDAYVVEYRRKDGSTFLAETTGVKFHDDDGRVLGFIGVHRDLTKQLEHDAERRRLDEVKSDFVATVSHELRTPLTSLLGTLALIERHKEAIPEDVDALVSMALRNGKRLGTLINDILDLEKLDNDRLTIELELFEVCDLVDDVLMANDSFAEQHDVELRLTCAVDEAHFFLDAGRFEQVLTNLISNAIKFSPAGEAVDVVVCLSDAATVRIAVTDRGPGIPADFQDQLFEKFAQATSSTTQRTPGTGLGLNIAKRLTEKMGGRIGFETAEGRGTTLYVEFPLDH